MVEDFFRWLDLDQISFWIGFLTGAVFFWVLRRSRPVFRLAGSLLLQRFHSLRANLTTSTELRLRADVLRTVQKRHIAHPLCALDEIIIEPKIRLPAPLYELPKEAPETETIEGWIPFLPEFPAVDAAFAYPTIPISKLFQRGADILLLGGAGTGKTVALAHLASLLARRDPELEDLSNYLPIFIDASDLVERKTDTLTAFDLCYSVVSIYASTMTQTRLNLVLKNALSTGRALLIVDGVDELPASQVQIVSVWLQELRNEFPGMRLVVAASPDNHDGLLPLDLHPAGMVGWNQQDKRRLFTRWQTIWQDIIHNQPINPFNAIDPVILENWQSSSSYFESPLFFTLRLWALTAGDLLGPNELTSIEAYIRRCIQDYPESRNFLSAFANRLLQDMKSSLPRSELSKLVSENVSVGNMVPGIEPDEPQDAAEPTAYKNPSARMIDNLISAGLLRSAGTESVKFASDTFAAYLVCDQFLDADTVSKVLNQPRWEFRKRSIWLLAATQDLSTPLLHYLDADDAPVESQVIECGLWLQFAHRSNTWTDQVLRILATQIQNTAKSKTFRLRILGALAACENKGIDILFRRMLGNYEFETREFGCLGSGLLQDIKALPELKSLLADPDAGVRQSACLALGAIGGSQSVESIAMSLLQNDEALQKCAAEMLACDPDEGHATLQEGSEFDNLLVRRAVVYGLKKVNAAWSTELLTKIHLEDPEWLVRNAAEQALEQLTSLHPSVPSRLPELANTPWIIEYASEQGLGVSTRQAAEEMLIQAIQKGDTAYRLSAIKRLPYLKAVSPGAISAVYSAYFGESGNIREMAYLALWLLSGRHIDLPEPISFGYY